MRYALGKVRDAILQVLATSPEGLPVSQIEKRVTQSIGPTPGSSIRSCLRLKTPETFIREERGVYRVRPEVLADFQGDLQIDAESWRQPFFFGRTTLIHGDCFAWLEERKNKSIHAVVTDPPVRTA